MLLTDGCIYTWASEHLWKEIKLTREMKYEIINYTQQNIMLKATILQMIFEIAFSWMKMFWH